MPRWPERTEAERFWGKVDASGDCWEWTSSLTPKGYGGFRAATGWRSAHRWAYEHLIGPIPDGMQIDHLCRVRHCVNPDHMEPVTNQVNQLRGIRSLRYKHYPTCQNGHDLTSGNLRWSTGANGRPMRVCRACTRERMRRWRERQAV